MVSATKRVAFFSKEVAISVVAFLKNLIAAVLIVIVVLLLVTGWLLLRNSPWGFVGAWFFLILAPTSSFFPITDLAFEHRMYLPLLPLVILFVLGIFLVSSRISDERQGVFFRRAMVICVVVALMGRTISRNEDYASRLLMWQDVAHIHFTTADDCFRVSDTLS